MYAFLITPQTSKCVGQNLKIYTEMSERRNPKAKTLHKTFRTCKNGHKYYKSSDCPTCPVCEAQRKPSDGFLSILSAPARRALEAKGITTPEQISAFSEKELLALHGLGPSTIPKLKTALAAKRLTLKNDLV